MFSTYEKLLREAFSVHDTFEFSMTRIFLNILNQKEIFLMKENVFPKSFAYGFDFYLQHFILITDLKGYFKANIL